MDLALDDDDGDAEGPTSHPLGFHIQNDYENCGDHMAVSLPIESNPEKAWMKMSLRMKLRETNNSQHESLRVFQSWTLMQFPAQLRPSFCV